MSVSYSHFCNSADVTALVVGTLKPMIVLIGPHVQNTLNVIQKATQSYEFWWLKLSIESPQHILIETGLICFIIWLIFIRRTVDPGRTTSNSKLTPKEVNDLIESWEPDDIVPSLSDDLEAIASKVMVVERVTGNYVKIRGIKPKVLNLCSFDFLGLSRVTAMKEEARAALDKYGCGSCGPRGFYGTIDQHLKIEEAVSKFLGTEEAIAYSDGASTVSSAIPAFAKKGDLLIIDEGCSEPILTGANLSRSTIIYFKHNDMKDLGNILQSIASDDKRLSRDSTQQRRFIIVEGVYRNTGKLCPLNDLIQLKEKYFYRLILDESLSFGTMGKTGRGVTEHFNVPISEVDIIMIAMDTALASVGGLCTGSREVVDHQRLSGAGYCFSASAPPFLSAAAVKALEHIENHPDLVIKLQKNANLLWNGLKSIQGLKVMSDMPTPIIHVILEPNTNATSTTTSIMKHGKVSDDMIIQQMSEDLIQSGYGVVYSKFASIETHAKKKKMSPSLKICVSSDLTEAEILKTIDRIRQCTQLILSLKS